MSSNYTFVMDTNVFIEAYKRYYSFDIAPSFWNALVQHAESGRINKISQRTRERIGQIKLLTLSSLAREKIVR